MQSIMQSILLFLLFLFFQVIRSQNYGTQQSVNDPYKTNTGIFNFNNILRNGLATGVSTVETGSNILQQPLRAATNLFQYAPESAANIQPGQYNENPYNSSPYNENLNPIQQGINTATSNFNNIMGAGLTSGINALEAGASILQLPLQAATNQFQYAPEGAANIQPGQYNENPYNSSPYNENLNPNQQGMNALKAGASIQQLPLYAATNQFQYAPEGAANIQPGQYNENPYNSSPYNENLNPNQQGMNALEAGASIQQLPLYAATNQFQYAPEGAANIQPGQYNENPYNSSPYNEHLNPNQQGMNALEAGASIQQLPLQAATNQFQYAPEGAANIQPGQYNENPYNSSPYNEHLNPNQQGMNALEAGASIQQLPLHAATNQFQYAPKGAANLQPGRYNENPYNSSPYNENLNPIQQGINTATSNFNNILRNGLATGVSTVETGSNILQQPLRAATNQFQYAPEGAANIQPGQYNENPYYNSSPYNENLNPIQKGINTATSNFNNIMGAGLTTGVTALGGGADILGQQLNGATNLVQNIPKFTSNGIDFLQNIGQTGTDMTNNVLKLSTAPIVAKLNKFGNVLNGFSSYSDPQNQIDQSNNIQVPSMNYEHRY